MIYIVVFVVVIGSYMLYKAFFSAVASLDDLSIIVRYRLQDHKGQYSGNSNSIHGTLVFCAFRKNDRLSNVVIKNVRVKRSSVLVRLKQIVVITFPKEHDRAKDVSMRFRAEKSTAVHLTGTKVLINGVLNFIDNEKRNFKLILHIDGIYNDTLIGDQK